MLISFSLLCEARVQMWCESSPLTSLLCVGVCGCRRGRGCGWWLVASVGGDVRGRAYMPGFWRATVSRDPSPSPKRHVHTHAPERPPGE